MAVILKQVLTINEALIINTKIAIILKQVLTINEESIIILCLETLGINGKTV